MEWLPPNRDDFSLAEVVFYVLFIHFALGMAGVAMAFVLVAKAFGNSTAKRRPRVSSGVAALCVAAGFLLAMPVAGGWDDGCNGHGAVFPAISIPYLALFTPQRGWLAYSDEKTLMLCFGELNGGGFTTWSLTD